MNLLNDISEFDISIRCTNTLRANGVNSMIELLKLDDTKLEEMRSISSFTKKEIRELQDELLTKDGVRYTISDEFPVNGDKVLTYHYGIWDYHKAPCPMPYWGNPFECVKLIKSI